MSNTLATFPPRFSSFKVVIPSMSSITGNKDWRLEYEIVPNTEDDMASPKQMNKPKPRRKSYKKAFAARKDFKRGQTSSLKKVSAKVEQVEEKEPTRVESMEEKEPVRVESMNQRPFTGSYYEDLLLLIAEADELLDRMKSEQLEDSI